MLLRLSTLLYMNALRGRRRLEYGEEKALIKSCQSNLKKRSSSYRNMMECVDSCCETAKRIACVARA
jgi:hypothetical protein